MFHTTTYKSVKTNIVVEYVYMYMYLKFVALFQFLVPLLTGLFQGLFLLDQLLGSLLHLFPSSSSSPSGRGHLLGQGGQVIKPERG